MRQFLPCRSRSCATFRFPMAYARRSQQVPISVSVMSSKFCCASQRNGGPKADTVVRLAVSELVNMGLDSLTEIFNLPLHSITRDLITSQAINWGIDAFARGAYSYATPNTREAQTALRKSDAGAVFFSGEALYAGRDIGTVEAALVSGTETAQAILAAG